MFKEILMFFKKNISIIILLIVFTLFLDRYFEAKRLHNSTDEALKHYYNKFCTKHFDVSCDKIKIK